MRITRKVLREPPSRRYRSRIDVIIRAQIIAFRCDDRPTGEPGEVNSLFAQPPIFDDLQ
jgi:hypothetical protein